MAGHVSVDGLSRTSSIVRPIMSRCDPTYRLDGLGDFAVPPASTTFPSDIGEGYSPEVVLGVIRHRRSQWMGIPWLRERGYSSMIFSWLF
jgi:hypothetical protein